MNRTSRDFRGVLFAAAAALSGCTDRADNAVGPDSAGSNPGSGASSSSSGSSSSGSNTGGDKAGSGNLSGAPNIGGGGGTAAIGAAGKPGADLSPPDPSCDLADVAFCDAFTKASPGGRAGALDDAHWSLSRLGFGCGYSFMFPET